MEIGHIPSSRYMDNYAYMDNYGVVHSNGLNATAGVHTVQWLVGTNESIHVLYNISILLCEHVKFWSDADLDKNILRIILLNLFFNCCF